MENASMVTRAYIDERRRQFLSSDRDDIPDTDLGRLYKRAISKYGTTCLWNCRPKPTESGMRVIADRLMKHGDLRAWYFAAEILQIIGEPEHAPRLASI
jgi:hypothetical protein